MVPPGTNEVEMPRVVNVILPEQQGHMTQQLGYILATFFLLALLLAAIIVLTRRRRKRGTVVTVHVVVCYTSTGPSDPQFPNYMLADIV